MSSTLCIIVPTGILASGNALPGLISALALDITVSPTANLWGARIYDFFPSLYKSSAMNADLFGSYSILSTFAGIS